MHLFTRGIDPDVLGSPRDVVLRSFMARERHTEIVKLMALESASLGNGKATADYTRKHIAMLFGRDESAEFKKTETKYQEMQDYYENVVKHLSPELREVRDEKGNKMLIARGLEGLI